MRRYALCGMLGARWACDVPIDFVDGQFIVPPEHRKEAEGGPVEHDKGIPGGPAKALLLLNARKYPLSSVLNPSWVERSEKRETPSIECSYGKSWVVAWI